MISQASMGLKDEWLETDGLGGFASGTLNGIRTRRYHALLLAATTPPTGRFILVNGFDAWVETASGTFPLSSQFYLPEVVHPDGMRSIESFEAEPWPRWKFALEDGTRIEQEIFAVHGSPTVAVPWRLVGQKLERARLTVRPFLSGRDYHSLHKENLAFRFDAEATDGRVSWRPYDSLPRVVAIHNGAYERKPDWYRNFEYQEERARGLDSTEDLAAPGFFHFDLAQGEAILIFSADEAQCGSDLNASTLLQRLRARELARRKKFPSPLHRAADAYLVKRGSGKTIVAGYPWFTDWGRDTFIALRGLCIATGRLEEARDILLEWSGAVSGGMLPNRFPDRGEQPEFNSVDASLWYVVAVHEFLKAKPKLGKGERKRLESATESILAGYVVGTRYHIKLDDDGLLAAGEPGAQLTWMDAKVGDWVATPRIGKPVEVQALWLNALKIAGRFNPKWEEIFARGSESFRARFWNEERGCLFDVIDVDHRNGATDASLRPNQIFAVGGLPFAVLEGEQAKRVVDVAEEKLYTPLGLRSLAPGEPGYGPRYEGGVRERDGAYHQGTVWPWLLGPFVEAWVRVHCKSDEVKREARGRFLDPLMEHLNAAGIGHVSEIADADPPHAPRGCPFQAWSLGEALRLSLDVLAEEKRKA